MVDPRTLDRVFGPGTGDTPEARARFSKVCFVRGLDQLGEDVPQAKGRRLTASEALEAYGFDALLEVASEGSALLAQSADAAGLPLRTRRSELGLDVRTVANRAATSVDELEACESSRRLPLRTYEKIARALGLDERSVAVDRVPKGNERLTVRLRRIGDDSGPLGQVTVAALAEAGWVAMTQARLAAKLGFEMERHGLERSPNFGSPGFPAYEWGYRLATETRNALTLSPEEPIASMRELIEDRFQIPLIQCDLGDAVAGATLETGAGRAIVVNLSGENRSVFVLRTTMAHELGHVIFDPVDKLDALRVDSYDDLGRSREQIRDHVEQRANAFAVEFLAPGEAVLAAFQESRDLTATVGRFGLGPTPTRHQLRNASRGTVHADQLRVAPPGSEEWRRFASWEGAELLAVLHFHPIEGIRPSRAGRFSAYVLRAAEEGFISWDTAAVWLETSEATARAARDGLRELFPSVWP